MELVTGFGGESFAPQGAFVIDLPRQFFLVGQIFKNVVSFDEGTAVDHLEKIHGRLVNAQQAILLIHRPHQVGAIFQQRPQIGFALLGIVAQLRKLANHHR